jgi:predicted AlkP superfamily phosphohydrolase/phosphomutase
MKEGFLALDSTAAGHDKPFAGVDWSRTRAYAAGLNGLYLNRAGREPNGIVDSRAADALIQDIRARLLSLRDPENGSQVVMSADVPSRRLAHAPDLLVGYAAPYRASWKTALGEVPEAVFEQSLDEWKGDHCVAARLVPGVLLVNAQARVPHPALADVTTTILRFFGVSPSPDMTGRELF